MRLVPHHVSLYSAGDESSKFAIRNCAERSVQVVIGNRLYIVHPDVFGHYDRTFELEQYFSRVLA